MQRVIICLIVLASVNVIQTHRLQTPRYKWPGIYKSKAGLVCGRECPGKFKCNLHSSPKCIDADLVCDGVADCSDGSDELKCRKEPDCVAIKRMLCLDKKTCAVPCNNKTECPTHEDELGCPFVCPEEHYKCDGVRKCIPIHEICDGKPNCPRKDDEANCFSKCTEGEYMCEGGDTCITLGMMCDGHHDCPQGDDEINCSCGNGQYVCEDVETCLPRDKVCDDKKFNCPSTSDDEASCKCACDVRTQSFDFFCDQGVGTICNEVPDLCDEIPLLRASFCE